jgi:hypothetical protein
MLRKVGTPVTMDLLMTPLTSEELYYLQHVLQGGVCKQSVLDGLLRRGLVESDPLVVLPQTPQGFGRRSYHLTAAGQAALRAAKQED